MTLTLPPSVELKQDEARVSFSYQANITYPHNGFTGKSDEQIRELLYVDVRSLGNGYIPVDIHVTCDLNENARPFIFRRPARKFSYDEQNIQGSSSKLVASESFPVREVENLLNNYLDPVQLAWETNRLASLATELRDELVSETSRNERVEFEAHVNVWLHEQAYTFPIQKVAGLCLKT